MSVFPPHDPATETALRRLRHAPGVQGVKTGEPRDGLPTFVSVQRGGKWNHWYGPSIEAAATRAWKAIANGGGR